MPNTDADHARVQAWGDELVKVHDWFREALATARTELGELLDGRPPSRDGQAVPSLGEQLRAHCLTFCEGLHGHHTIEDTVMFPSLQEDYPELGAVLERLRQEHHVVGRLLDDLQALLTEPGAGDVGKLRAEFEQLATELESHLDYEEEQLVPLLNTLTTLPWERSG